jgi:hypothetical protein
MRWCKVGACRLSKPPNGADDALVFPFAFSECGMRLVFVGFRACIDGKTRAIHSSVRRDVVEMNVVVFDQVRRKASLTEMDLHGVRGD